MHNILSRLLQKRGISDSTELTKEERKDFEQWQKVLIMEDITVETILDFCNGELIRIESQFKDIQDSSEKKVRLTLLHGVYASIRDVITKPKIEREALIRYLESQLSTD